MTGNVLAIMCAAILSAIVSTRELALGGVTPAPTASPTPTEGIHEIRCGDGITGPSEQCDDGNLYDGDGCSSNCVGETFINVGFEPLREDVGEARFPAIVSIPGHIVIAAQGLSAVIREFQTQPVGVPQSGIFCLRPVAPQDSRFGPGNIGRGLLGPSGSSESIFAATLLVEEWLNPSEGFRVDLGADGIACTDDDPGLPNARQEERQLNLALRLDSCGGDINRDGRVMIEELVTAVHNALGGCPSP